MVCLQLIVLLTSLKENQLMQAKENIHWNGEI